jgi:hypothetical protein
MSEEIKKGLCKIFEKILTLFSEMSRANLLFLRLDKERCHIHTELGKK